MKRVQLSGAQKRKRAKENEQKTSAIVAKTKKLTDFFTQRMENDDVEQSSINLHMQTSESSLTHLSETNSIDARPAFQVSNENDEVEVDFDQCQTLETTNKANVFSSSISHSVDASPDFESVDVHDEVNQPGTSSTATSVIASEQSRELNEMSKDEMNKANDPGLWDEFHSADGTYWVGCGPSECQHHNGPFTKSCRNFSSGKPKRYCTQKIFFGVKANVEHYKREWLLYSPSKGSVYCFVCKLFAPKDSTHLVRNDGFSDWRNNAVIDNHEKCAVHRDAMLTYLTRKLGLGLTQPLEKQIEAECNYWENVLRRVVAVIRTLAERGLSFRGTNEKFGALDNGNFLGLLELISQFDPFLAAHISRYGNAGRGNPSYLPKTICEELIELIAKKVHSVIFDEVNAAGYFSLSVDSSPDVSHVDQLSVVLRYLQDGQPVEQFITFLELQNHTGEAMAHQVLKYLSDKCKVDFAKCRGQSYDNAANVSGRYNGMQQKLLEANKFAIYVPCAAHSLNLVGRSAVNCCQSAVDFFSLVQTLYNFFTASSSRWRILKSYIGNERVLKSLSDTRWEAHAVATAAIIKSYSQIVEALENLSDDQLQKGETRREARNIANKMQELEFVFMLNFWNEILQKFHKTSKCLQSESAILQTCADLYLSLADLLNTSRDEFERFESLAKDMLPGVDYKETQKRNRIRKKMPNDGNALEDKRSARDNFRISTFYEILDKLTTEMKRRGKIYTNIAHKFSCLTDVPNATQQGANYSQYSDRQRYLKTCQMLIDAYPEDLNNALPTEL